MADKFGILVSVKADTATATKNLKATDDAVKGLGSSTASMSDKMATAGTSMTNAGKKLSLGLTVPLLAAATASTKLALVLNEGMANIATLIPNSTARVMELKDGIKDMAVETGKGFGDLTDGLYQVISAYGDNEESLDRLEVTAKAARAGLASTTDALNLISAVTKGYGDTSAGAQQKVSDLAFMTVKLGQTTFPELASAIRGVTDMSVQLGVKQEDLFASFATLTGVTGSASEVTTQLKGAMAALVAPKKELKNAMLEMGYATGQAMVAQEGLGGAFVKIKNYADANNISMKELVPRIRGMTAISVLGGKQAETYAWKLDEMNVAAGATDTAFAEATQGINAAGFAMDQAKQRLAGVGSEIGDMLLPKLADLATKISVGIGKFMELNESTQRFIIGLAGFAAGIGPAVSAIGALTKALAFLAANPVVLAITAVAGLTLGIVALGKKARETQLDKLSEEFKDVAGAAGLVPEQIDQIQYSLAKMGDNPWAVASDDVKTLSENLEISESAIVAVGLESQFVTDSYKEQLELVQDQIDLKKTQLEQEEAQRVALWARVEAEGRARGAAYAAAEAKANGLEIDERLAVILEKQAVLIERAQKIDAVQAAGALTELEALEEKIQLRQELVDEIKNEAKLTGEASAAQVAAMKEEEKKINNYIKRVEYLTTQESKLADEQEEAAEKEKEHAEMREEFALMRMSEQEQELAALETQRAEYEESKVEQFDIDQWYDDERTRINEQYEAERIAALQAETAGERAAAETKKAIRLEEAEKKKEIAIKEAEEQAEIDAKDKEDRVARAQQAAEEFRQIRMTDLEQEIEAIEIKAQEWIDAGENKKQVTTWVAEQIKLLRDEEALEEATRIAEQKEADKQAADEKTALKEATALKQKEISDAALALELETLQAEIDAERESQQERADIQFEFFQLGMSQHALALAAIEEKAMVYRQAGVSDDQVNQWVTEEKEKLDAKEHEDWQKRQNEKIDGVMKWANLTLDTISTFVDLKNQENEIAIKGIEEQIAYVKEMNALKTEGYQWQIDQGKEVLENQLEDIETRRTAIEEWTQDELDLIEEEMDARREADDRAIEFIESELANAETVFDAKIDLIDEELDANKQLYDDKQALLDDELNALYDFYDEKRRLVADDGMSQQEIFDQIIKLHADEGASHEELNQVYLDLLEKRSLSEDDILAHKLGILEDEGMAEADLVQEKIDLIEGWNAEKLAQEQETLDAIQLLNDEEAALAQTLLDEKQRLMDEEEEAEQALLDEKLRLTEQFAADSIEATNKIADILEAQADREDVLMTRKEELLENEERIQKELNEERATAIEDERIAREALMTLIQTLANEEETVISDLEEEKKVLLLENWEREKKMKIAQASINAIGAGIRAFVDLGPIGGAIMAAVLAGTLAAQIALISNTPAPFAEGTGQEGYIVPPGYENDSFPVAASSGERVTVDTPADQEGGGGSGQPMEITLVVDSQVLGQIITDGTEDGTIQIDGRSIVTRN